MSKKLTKRQKEIEVHRAIKKTIKDYIEPVLLNRLKNALNSEKTLKKHFKEGDNSILDKILVEFCKNHLKDEV